MDPLVASIVMVLGKYMVDKGIELGKEIGPKALDKVKEMAGMALDKLRGKPDAKPIVDEYEKDPEAYQKPLEKKLADAMADPEFAAKLKGVYEQYAAEAKAFNPQAAVSYSATVKGSGAIAQGPGAMAAGAGGVVVGGSVQGGVNTGGAGTPKQEDK